MREEETRIIIFREAKAVKDIRVSYGSPSKLFEPEGIALRQHEHSFLMKITNYFKKS